MVIHEDRAKSDTRASPGVSKQEVKIKNCPGELGKMPEQNPTPQKRIRYSEISTSDWERRWLCICVYLSILEGNYIINKEAIKYHSTRL